MPATAQRSLALDQLQTAAKIAAATARHRNL